MSDSFKDVQIPFFKEGLIQDSEVAETVAVNNSVNVSTNWNFDSIGAAQTRPGIQAYLPSPVGEILSLGQFAQNASSVRRLLYQVANHIYSWNGTTSSSVRTLSNSNKARYCQFANYTYMVNGYNNDPIQTFDGTSFSATNVGALPTGDFIETFESRVVVAQQATDNIYFTDVVQPSGTITGGGTNPLYKLSPGNGQKIRALKTVPRALLVFKDESIYRIYSLDPNNPNVDPYPAYNVGTYSQESIVDSKDGFYFHSSKGFYKFNFDGQPIEISRRISGIVSAISRTNYEKVHGWTDKEGNHIYWSVGDLELENGTIENAIVRYTVNSEVWTVYSHVNKVTASIVYDDGTNILPLVGYSTAGYIGRYGVGTDDIGDPIFVDLQTRAFIMTESYSRLKQIDKVSVICYNGAGLNVSYARDNYRRNRWEPIGKVTSEFISFLSVPDTLSFNQIRFRLFGAIVGEPIVLYGIEVIKLAEEGYRYN